MASLVMEGGLVVLAAIFLFPAVARAQLFVRPVSAAHRQSSPPMDGSPVDIAGDPVTNTNLPRVTTGAPTGAEFGAGAIDDEQGQILIEQYRREAGKAGPRKLVSDYKIEARASVSVAYDDNILAARRGQERDDVLTTLVGGLTLLLGDYVARERSFLVLDYAARGEIFAANSDENALNHDASLLVRYRPHDVLVQLTSAYTLTHEASADVGQRVGRQLFGEGLLFRYFRNDRTTLEAEADYSRNLYDEIATTTQVWGGAAVDYLVVDRVTLGAGAVFGNLAATGALDENFQQLQGRFGYSVSRNVALSLRAGLEVRETGGAGTRLNPVFSLSGSWTPFGGTSFTLEGHRRTEASASLAGNDLVNTGIQAGVRQRLFERFHAALDAGYENADYQNVTSDHLTARNDDYFNLRAAFGYEFVEWMKLEAVYLFRSNRSNQPNYTFTTNRFGLQASFIY